MMHLGTSSELPAEKPAQEGDQDLFQALSEISVRLEQGAAHLSPDIRVSLLSLLSAQRSFLRHMCDLEKQPGYAREWEIERQNYLLRDFGGGTFAYTHRQRPESGRFCVSCFQSEKLSPLTRKGRTSLRQEIHVCNECETVFHLGRARDAHPPSRASVG